MIKRDSLRGFLGFFILGVIIMVAIFVSALSPPSWTAYETTSRLTEDTTPAFTYNLSSNLTNVSVGASYNFQTLSGNPIISSLYGGSQTSGFYTWISLNSSTGILTINSTKDNETGMFNISVDVVNNDSQSAGSRWFYFIINATNDAPVFSVVNRTYRSYQNQNFSATINATDEESHYPLVFSANFTSCNLSSWSTRGEGNCTLFSFYNTSNTSAIVNFTPTQNDAGIYYINLSVRDAGQNYNCSSGYCASDYSQNKTTYYSQLIEFSVLSSLRVNASNCSYLTVQENESFQCPITIYTQGQNDSLRAWSNASVTSSSANAENSSWFYAMNNSVFSSGFTKVIYANFTPGKREVGNWTINFSVTDVTFGDAIPPTQIYFYVNRTYNSLPQLVQINNITTSVDLLATINLTVYDNDLMIPDKSSLFGGYNETTNFTISIQNTSGSSKSFSNLSIGVLNMPVISGGFLTNRTEAIIRVTPNSSETGVYIFNITALDRQNASSSRIFNITVLSNNFPYWNQTSYYFKLAINSTFNTTSGFYINLTNNYVTDPNNDSLTFTNTSAFPSLSLTSLGIINFTPYKQDVGLWIVNISANDTYLVNASSFTFNISNINSIPIIDATSISSFSATANESLPQSIRVDIYDDDFLITQKDYYNESLTFRTTITNITEVPNPILFDFNLSYLEANHTIYLANFTPVKSNIGNYTITINVTDYSNASVQYRFNLTVLEVNNAPSLMNLSNKYSAVNRNFYYRINATDIEDGDSNVSGNNNLTLSYSFLQGTDFINQTIFNNHTGVMNITFNSSQAGKYHINITVNDTGKAGVGVKQDSKDFWIYVYDTPNITSPVASTTFNFEENSTNSLIFSANHTIGDNLTYILYLNGIVRTINPYYGNSTNFTSSFSANFSDETYGKYKNLTLLVYPSNSELENNIAVNFSLTWNINITHVNAPLTFDSNIQNYTLGGSLINLTLSSYFSDIDAQDSYYNQSVGFVAKLINTTSGSITTSVINWTNASTPSATFSATTSSSALFRMEAYEYNLSNYSQAISNLTSNTFNVELNPTVNTVTTTAPSTGGGGGATKIQYYSLKIVLPEEITISDDNFISVPFSIRNSGQIALYGINLSSIIKFNDMLSNNLKVSIPNTNIDKLLINESVNMNMIIATNTHIAGRYKATVFANVTSPNFFDWGDFYIELKKSNETDAESMLVFTQKLISENPECIELTEIVKESQRLLEAGDVQGSLKKSNEAMNACEDAISSNEQFGYLKSQIQGNFYYILGATVFLFMFGLIFYIYKRAKFNKYREEDYMIYNNNG